MALLADSDWFRCSSFGHVYIVTEFAKALQLVNQSAAADAKCFGRFRPVEIMFAQRLHDGLSSVSPEPFGCAGLRGAGRWHRRSDFGGQMLRQDQVAQGEQGGALHRV